MMMENKIKRIETRGHVNPIRKGFSQLILESKIYNLTSN